MAYSAVAAPCSELLRILVGMPINDEEESSGAAWTKLFLGIAAAGLTVLVFANAAAWWEFATAAIAAMLSLTLTVVGVRDLVRRQHRSRADWEAAQSEEPHPG